MCFNECYPILEIEIKVGLMSAALKHIILVIYKHFSKTKEWAIE